MAGDDAIVTRAAPRGVCVVDKPQGMTSFAVVKRVRRLLGVRKAGHTGTLDPLATGVLPVCVGEATKIAGLLQVDDKVYAAEARLGLRTDTMDSTGAVLEERDPGAVTREHVREALAGMGGEQQQVPPAYSAIRVGGRRAHELARRGEAVELAARTVTIHALTLLAWEPPRVTFRVACSKGTYVRVIIDQLGQRLGVGATMTALRRERSGGFDLSRAVTLEQLERDPGAVSSCLVSMDRALSHLPAVAVSADQAAALRKGQPVDPRVALPAGPCRVRTGEELVALGAERGGRLWPRRVFAREPAPDGAADGATSPHPTTTR